LLTWSKLIIGVTEKFENGIGLVAVADADGVLAGDTETQSSKQKLRLK